MAVALYGEGEKSLRLVERLVGVEIHARGNEVHIDGEESRRALARRVLEELYALHVSGQGVRGSDIRHVVKMLDTEPDIQLNEIYENILSRGSRRVIRAKNLAQRRYVDLMRKHDIAIAIGPAGTGKTYLAMAMAVAALHRKEISRIILTRPAVEAGERLGFLPGDLMAKIDPYLRPLYDALYDMVDPEGAARLLERGTVEVAPLAFMRGRTLNNSFIILDEAQNTSPQQMKMFLTRIGFGSKVVVTGDATQVDVPDGRSGVMGLERVLGGIDQLAFVRLSSDDVVRHQIVADIVAAYERDSESNDSGSRRTRHGERAR